MDNEDEQQGQQRTEANEEKVTGRALERMRLSQGNRCYYSGEELTLENVCVDHKQPISKGGKHLMSNVALCTQRINSMKGTMSENEFISACLSIASHVPSSNAPQGAPVGGGGQRYFPLFP